MSKGFFWSWWRRKWWPEVTGNDVGRWRFTLQGLLLPRLSSTLPSPEILDEFLGLRGGIWCWWGEIMGGRRWKFLTGREGELWQRRLCFLERERSKTKQGLRARESRCNGKIFQNFLRPIPCLPRPPSSLCSFLLFFTWIPPSLLPFKLPFFSPRRLALPRPINQGDGEGSGGKINPKFFYVNRAAILSDSLICFTSKSSLFFSPLFRSKTSFLFLRFFFFYSPPSSCIFSFVLSLSSLCSSPCCYL